MTGTQCAFTCKWVASQHLFSPPALSQYFLKQQYTQQKNIHFPTCLGTEWDHVTHTNPANKLYTDIFKSLKEGTLASLANLPFLLPGM